MFLKLEKIYLLNVKICNNQNDLNKKEMLLRKVKKNDSKESLLNMNGFKKKMNVSLIIR